MDKDLFPCLITNIAFTETPCLTQHRCSTYKWKFHHLFNLRNFKEFWRWGKKKGNEQNKKVHCTFFALHKTIMTQMGKILQTWWIEEHALCQPLRDHDNLVLSTLITAESNEHLIFTPGRKFPYLPMSKTSNSKLLLQGASLLPSNDSHEVHLERTGWFLYPFKQSREHSSNTRNKMPLFTTM